MSRNKKIETIIRFGDPRLRVVCSEVAVFHKGLHDKIDCIARTLHEHGGGAALAAPQIALLKQIVVIDYLGEYYELINPRIVEASGSSIDYEGCLSLPGFWGQVERHQRIKVSYQDRFGELHSVDAHDRMARCFQHEIDHLSGVLFIDRMSDEYVFNDDTKERLPVAYLRNATRSQ
ncbi:peptide deformylase [Sediminispirochaeta bajacaliforniensis]|uniref:peptide deformylase n=1 Tax=Sediminispirochaeta bajacaliforniensis TaxID=148 RepID=UPI0003816529|nr:peptide deformylase [Sediminispirochaeta bajacaliforniensis]